MPRPQPRYEAVAERKEEVRTTEGVYVRFRNTIARRSSLAIARLEARHASEVGGPGVRYFVIDTTTGEEV